MLIIKEKDEENAGKECYLYALSLFLFKICSSWEQKTEFCIFMLMFFVFCTLAFCVRI